MLLIVQNLGAPPPQGTPQPDLSSLPVAQQPAMIATTPTAQHLILMIADGWGYKQIEAANLYTGQNPAYQAWSHYAMSTFPAGSSYIPELAWSDFRYVIASTTDSAAAATAMYTGAKTANGRISVSPDGSTTLFTIGEQARTLGMAVGAVSSVYVSHATPGAWIAHNRDRENGYAIVEEALWGISNRTNTRWNVGLQAAAQVAALPPVDVLIGAGHPEWNGGRFVKRATWQKLASESGQPGAYTFVERIADSPDGGARLLDAASDPAVTRLVGLVGWWEGNLDWRKADGSGQNPENPTLAEMTQAALTVLQRDEDGFALLIEGGAVDWAAHANHMDRMLGELNDFNDAVQTVIAWVDDQNNSSNWDNTLVIVTGDHETGYLTAGAGVFPNVPLGRVSDATLAMEKRVAGTARRASWDDKDGDSRIDPHEPVHWAWNTVGHTNSLIPFYAQGAGDSFFALYATGEDPVRGAYLDNTDIFKVMALVLQKRDLAVLPTRSN